MFAPVHEYQVFEHPVQGFDAVKIGWLWPAFFFTFIWALNKRLWPWATVILIGYALIVSASIVANVYVCETMINRNECILLNTIIIAVVPSLAVLIGRNGSTWRELNLIRRGYRNVGTQGAQSPEAAIAQHAYAMGYHWRATR